MTSPTLIHEKKQIIVLAVIGDVEQDGLPEVEHLSRREPGHGAPQVRSAVIGEFPHLQSAATTALDCDQYPCDQFRDLSGKQSDEISCCFTKTVF